MKIIATFVTLSIILFFLAFTVASIKYSITGEGEHTGYITAIEQKGFVFKNYQVYVKTDLSSSQEDVYCVHESKKEIAKQLTLLQRNKERATVLFKGSKGFGMDLCSGDEIYGVER